MKIAHLKLEDYNHSARATFAEDAARDVNTLGRDDPSPDYAADLTEHMERVEASLQNLHRTVLYLYGATRD